MNNNTPPLRAAVLGIGMMGAPMARRLRATISTDDLEFFRVQEGDVLDTIALLGNGATEVASSQARVIQRIITEREGSCGKAAAFWNENFTAGSLILSPLFWPWPQAHPAWRPVGQ